MEAVLRRWAHIIIPGTLLAVGLVLRVRQGDWVRNLQDHVFDAFQRLDPRQYQPTPIPIRVVDIDDATLKRLGPWPWPRTQVARLVDRLTALKVRVLAFDIIFAEPDRSGPEAVAQLIKGLPDSGPLAARIAKMPDPDLALAKAMRRLPAVVGFVSTGEREAVEIPVKAGVAFAGDDPARFLPDFPGAIVNIPPISRAAAGSGSLSLFPEFDGVTRRVPLLVRRGSSVYPSLALEALRVGQGAGGVTVKSTEASGILGFGQHTGINQIEVGRYKIPTDSEGQIWMHYSEFEPRRSIPAWKVLSTQLAPSELDGAIVYLGGSALRLKDLRSTPLDPAYPGVDIHAQVSEQILLGDFLRRPDWADGLEICYLLALGVALIVLLPRLGALGCGLFGLSIFALAFPLSWWAYSRWHWLLDPLFPSLVTLLVYLASSSIAFVRSESERARLALADRMKDELIQIVSHDLRGPVSSMMMMADTIRAGTYGSINENQEQALRLIEESGQRLTAFVTNVLDAAKMKAGRLQLHKRSVKAQQGLSHTLDLCSFQAELLNVSIENRLPKTLPPILADPELLEHIFANLIGNALKFSPKKGRVRIEGKASDDYIRFEIRDEGPGIARDKLPLLFQPFRRLDLERQQDAKISGTGLGLSICKEIVDAHEGKIWAESKLGAGTSFFFTIPRFMGGED